MFSALVKVLFSTCLSSEFLIQASKEVFEQSDTIHGLALVMVKYVADNFTNYTKEFQIKFLSDCLIFGPIFKKDQVIFSLTNEFIFHNEYSVNYIEGIYVEQFDIMHEISSYKKRSYEKRLRSLNSAIIRNDNP